MGLITLPIITRALGPEGYGNYNLVLLIVQYTYLPISLLGLKSYGIREIASGARDNKYALSIISMQFSIAILAVFISAIITYFFFKKDLLLYLSIIIGYIIVFANAFNLEFFYVAKKNLIFPTIARMIGQMVYVLGVLLFIKEPNDVPILVFLAAMTPSIAGLIQLRKFHLDYKRLTIRATYKQTLQTFKTTYRLGISSNLEGFIPSIPLILIQIILGAYTLGIFSGGYKIYSILVMFYVTFFYALAPYLIGLEKHQIRTRRKYHLLVLGIIISFSAIIGITLFKWGEPILILILGKSFGESVIVFKAISLILIPLTPISMLLGNILIYSKREKYYLNSLIISGLTILISSPFLLKQFDAVGAVYAIALSTFSGISLMSFYYFQSEGSNIRNQK